MPGLTTPGFAPATPAPLPPPGPVAAHAAGQRRSRGSYLTTLELSTDIAAELRRKDIKDPKVSVEVDTYRPFFIVGEVKRPGGYLYVNAMTVEAAVALAEGYAERAKKRMVRLTRRFNGVNSAVMVPSIIPCSPATLFTFSNASSKAH